jgi:hypothetical protein
MTQIKDYQVNYSINVTATEGVQEVEKFAKAMKQLSDARSNFMPAVNSVNDMMQHIDKVFRPKGRKREYTYKFDIDTGKSEKKLESIKALLTDIKELTTGINVVINAGQKLDTNTIRSQAKALVGKKELEAQKRSIRKTASQSLKTVNEKQREVTGVIGKINSALTSLEAGREINIRTDAAKNRLTEILGLLRQIKTASDINMPFRMGSGKGTSPATTPFQTGSILTDKVWQRQQKQVAKAGEARTMREIEARQEAEYQQNIQKKKDAFRRTNEWLERRAKNYEYYERAKVERVLKQEREEERRQKREAAGAARRKREQEREEKRNVMNSVRNMQRQAAAGESAYGGKRRAAFSTPAARPSAACRW